MTTGGLQQARQDAISGGFARAVGAEQAEKFALLNIKADVIQGLERATRTVKAFTDGLKGNGCHRVKPMILRLQECKRLLSVQLQRILHAVNA
jgi:hypothetical protein